MITNVFIDKQNWVHFDKKVCETLEQKWVKIVYTYTNLILRNPTSPVVLDFIYKSVFQ